MSVDNTRWLAAFAATLVCSACSSQAEPDYRGEPLAVVHGEVITGEATAPGEQLAAAIIWATSTKGLVAASMPVSGSFPAAFRLELVEPPPPEAFESELPDPTSPPPAMLEVVEEYAIGAIGAVPVDKLDTILSRRSDVAGIAMDWGIVYFSRAPRDENDPIAVTARWHNVPATPGYHLYSIARGDMDAYARCWSRNLCVTYVPSSEFHDFDLARCLRVNEHPDTCTIYQFPSNLEEEEASRSCREEFFKRSDSEVFDGTVCGDPWSHPGNPQGFDASVTVRLDRSFLDWLY